MTQQKILQELRQHGGSLAVAAANEIETLAAIRKLKPRMSGRLIGCSMSADGVGKWTEVCALEKPARM